MTGAAEIVTSNKVPAGKHESASIGGETELKIPHIFRLNEATDKKINSIKGLHGLLADSPLVSVTFSEQDGSTSKYEARLGTGDNGLYLHTSDPKKWPTQNASLVSIDFLHVIGGDAVIPQRLDSWPETAKQAFEVSTSSTVRITMSDNHEIKQLFIRSIDAKGLICAAEIDRGIKASEEYFQVDSKGNLVSPEYGPVGKIKSITALTCHMKFNLKDTELPSIPVMSYQNDPPKEVDSISPLEMIQKGSNVSITTEHDGSPKTNSYTWHGVHDGDAVLITACAGLTRMPLNQIVELSNFGSSYDKGDDLARKFDSRPADKFARGHMQVTIGVNAREDIPLLYHGEIFKN